MIDPAQTVIQASTVAINGRALMIEGPPGSGKSSLALALIDRGATLIGDDAVTVQRREDILFALPPPNIDGLLEVRGVGLVTFPTADPTPLALILSLGETGERLPETLQSAEILGLHLPILPFNPDGIAPAIRAEHALQMHGRLHSMRND